MKLTMKTAKLNWIVTVLALTLAAVAAQSVAVRVRGARRT